MMIYIFIRLTNQLINQCVNFNAFHVWEIKVSMYNEFFFFFLLQCDEVD